jgi:hypothetical protein
VPEQFRHEALTETHHLGVRFPLRIEIRTALSPAHRQGGEAVLVDLFERQEFEDPEVDRGMETQPALVGSDRARHLDPEPAVHVDLALVVHPGDPEHEDPLGLHHALDDLGGTVLRVLFEDEREGVEDLLHRLVKFRFVGILCLDFR